MNVGPFYIRQSSALRLLVLIIMLLAALIIALVLTVGILGVVL